MALSVVKAGNPALKSVKIDWPSVQFAQFEHDEKYHREISRLSVQDRLRHMALHFAKYAGRLHEDLSETAFKQTVVDALIIAISSANTLNCDLTNIDFRSEAALCNRNEFTSQLTMAAGRMAAFCERLDHLEDVPFRAGIQSEVLSILGACLSLLHLEGWCAVDEMKSRLAPIKRKHLFFGKL